MWQAEKTGAGVVWLVPVGSSWMQPGTNRLTGVQCDAAGNQTQYNTGNVQLVADYDGEGRIWQYRQVVGGTSTVLGTNLYNGEARRVVKSFNGVSTYYLYGLDGEIAAEYSTGGTGTAGTQYVVTEWFSFLQEPIFTLAKKRHLSPVAGG